MKRAGNLWHKIVDLENIKLAHQQARRKKAFYTEVKMVDADIERYCKQIQEMLVNKTFTTSDYEKEVRFDGRKERVIYKLPYFPDRIVQHALLNIIGSILTKSFIRDTFQSIQGRGTYDAMMRVKKLVRSENCPQYALKIDVSKYYPSVDNNLLKELIRRKIKCKDTLWLIDNIIDSTNGLPIGNYTSQHFGNLYLNWFDWWMKQEVKPVGYYRYCDDIVVLGNSVKELCSIKEKMLEKLALLKLSIKHSWSICDVRHQGLDFVGFRFRPGYTKLRKNIAKNFADMCVFVKSNLKTMPYDIALSKLMAYKGWVKYSNAKGLWRHHLTAALYSAFPKQLRGAI